VYSAVVSFKRIKDSASVEFVLLELELKFELELKLELLEIVKSEPLELTLSCSPGTDTGFVESDEQLAITQIIEKKTRKETRHTKLFLDF